MNPYSESECNKRVFRRQLFLRDLPSGVSRRVAERMCWPRRLDGIVLYFQDGRPSVCKDGVEILRRWTQPVRLPLDKK